MMTTHRVPIRAVEDLAGRRAVVLGLARSGVAASRFLADAGAIVAAYDRRPPEELADAIAALAGRPVRLALGIPEIEVRALLAHAELLVTSPSISTRFPTTDPWLREALVAAVDGGAEIVSEVDLFLRLTRARIVGVTGTKGKTTTASLVAAMLETAGIPSVLGGNIGTPLIEAVDELTSDHWAVLELSELQLPTISRGVDVAVYTNVTADHLDRHGTVEAYRAVKRLLAERSAERGEIVLNADDPGCVEIAAHVPALHVVWYGIDEPSREGIAPPTFVRGGEVVLAGTPVLPVADVRLPGRHMLADVLAAATAAALAGAAHEPIAQAIRGFAGVPHRLETVGERGGVRFVNDSQATIPAAAIAALESFDAPIVLIAGGQDKGLEYDAFADAIAARCRRLVLIGETADELDRLVAGRVPTERTGDMEEAVRRASQRAEAGDVVLLAPAAASFDMFRDYAARGDAFRAAVHALDGS